MEQILSPDVAPPIDRTACTGEEAALVCTPARYLLIGLGWFNVALGVIGIFLPLMPTTVFLLIAIWLFSKSSVRFQRWLYDHPRLGGPLRAWHTHGVIPNKAKLAALGMMSTSWLIIVFFVADGWLLPLGVAMVLIPVATFIATRPGVPA